MANDFQLDFIANAQKLDSSIKSAVQSKTYKIKVEADGTQVQSLTKSTEKFVDAQGRAIQVNTNFDKSGKATFATIKDITKETKNAGTAIDSTSKKTKSFGADFVSTLGKVAKFYVITKIIQTFTQGISEAVKNVKEFDDSLIELQKVSSEAKSNLSGFTDQAFDLAESMSTSASAVTDAVTEFSKSGYGLQDSLDLAEQAMIFQTIADGAISASDSAKVLIQTMKAYSMTNSEASHIVDALNEVDKLAFLIEI